MATLQIVKPEDGVNLALNPSFEGTTGYTAYSSGTVTRTLASASTPTRHSWYTLRVQTAGSNRGVTLTTATLASATHYASFWVSGTWTALRIGINSQAYTPALLETDGSWKRYGVSISAADANGQTSFNVYDTTTGADFYLDDVLLQATSYVTTYFDGSMGAGFRWAGPVNASTSKRYAVIPGTAAPNVGHGRLYDFDSSVIVITGASGLGLPSVQNLAQDQAVIPGKAYYNTRFAERTIALALTVIGGSVGGLHSQRKTLISYMQIGDPFVLRYTGADTSPGTTRTLEATCIYAGGLELSLRNDNGWVETPAVALTCLDPVFRQTSESALYLTSYSTTASSDTIFGRVESAWGRLGSGSSITAARSLAIAPNQQVYAAGGSIVMAWDGQAGTWGTVLTVRGGSALVHSIAFDQAGTALYVGGDFATATVWGGGTVAAANVAMYNMQGAATGGTAYAMGSGVNAVCYAVHPTKDGNYVMAGGAMTQANGTASVAMARWNLSGNYWQAFTTQPASGTVYGIDSAPNGDIWVGGNLPAFGTMAAMGALTSGTAVGTTYWYMDATTNRGGTAAYEVTAVNASGEGAASAASTTRSITTTNNKVFTLSWSSVTGATSYRIYRQASTGGTALEPYFTYLATTTATSYTDDGSVSDGTFTAYPGAIAPSVGSDGVRSVGIARYNAADATWRTVGKPGGPGFTSGKIVYDILLAPDGQSIYAALASDNTTVDGLTVAGVAYCKNGAVWYALSSGLSGGDVRTVDTDDAGGVWFGGAHTSGGPNASTQLAYLARWLGYENGVWLPSDLSPGAAVMALAHSGVTKYAGLLSAQTPTVAASASVTYAGTFANWPRIEILGPLVVRWIENATTAARLYFTPNPLTIAAGEVVTVQLDPRKFSVSSSTRGLLRTALSGASDITAWRMRPGSNTLVIYGTGSSGATAMRVIDSVAHLSMDAGAA